MFNLFRSCLIVFGLFQSCSPKYTVDIDSICSPESIPKYKYVFVPGNEGCKASDLQFIEFSRYLSRVIDECGYEKVDNVTDAEIAIVLSYSVSDPLISQYTYSTPIYGETGISSSTTRSSVYKHGNCSTYSGTTTYTPTYGIVGSTTHVGTIITYVHSLTMAGVDVQKVLVDKDDYVELWNTKVVTSAESGDLRRVFPIMIAAARDYIGKNTGNKIQIILREDDQRVLNLKGI